MSTEIQSTGVDDLPGWVKRSWLVPLVIGLALTIFGVVMLLNIDAGVRTLRWLVVIGLLLAAVEAFATASLRRRPWVGWLCGALYVVGAIIGTVWPAITLEALAIVVGASFALGGLVQTGYSWSARRTAHGWGWGFALGVLTFVAGLVFLFGNPIITAAVLAVVLACYTILAGVTLLVLAFAVRRITSAVGDALRDSPRPAQERRWPRTRRLRAPSGSSLPSEGPGSPSLRSWPPTPVPTPATASRCSHSASPGCCR
jgi:uncharacterized membrane protein HdeD (DUF308 family)